MHSTNDLDDGYLGSGKRLRQSIRKYGKEHHSVKILEFLPNRKALGIRERMIVNEVLLLDKKCLNIALGGSGRQRRPRKKWRWKKRRKIKRKSG